MAGDCIHDVACTDCDRHLACDEAVYDKSTTTTSGGVAKLLCQVALRHDVVVVVVDRRESYESLCHLQWDAASRVLAKSRNCGIHPGLTHRPRRLFTVSCCFCLNIMPKRYSNTILGEHLESNAVCVRHVFECNQSFTRTVRGAFSKHFPSLHAATRLTLH